MLTREAAVACVLALLAERPEPDSGDHSSRLICIDGPAGAGKTSWSAQLARALRSEALASAKDETSSGGQSVQVIHLDDTYDGWQGLPGVAPRLLSEVIEPLRSGRPASYARYDWAAGAFAERIAVPPSEVLILEGVGSGHRCLEPVRDLLVWVVAPDSLCWSRGLARDGEGMRAQWAAWKADEAAYFREQDLPARADLIVDGS